MLPINTYGAILLTILLLNDGVSSSNVQQPTIVQQISQPSSLSSQSLPPPSPVISPVTNNSKIEGDKLYYEAVMEIFNAFSHASPNDFKGCGVSRDCTNWYQTAFSTIISNLRYMPPQGALTSQNIQGIMQRLTQLQQSFLNNLRSQKLPYSLYVLMEISDETKERLKKGERIHFPSTEQLQKIDPKLLKTSDVEILLFQKSVDLERSQSSYGVSSVNTFMQQQKQWIQYLHQTHHRHVRSHLETLLNRVYDRFQHHDVRLEALTFLQNVLPEQERAQLQLSQDATDPATVMAQQFLNDLKSVKESYTDKPFDEDSQKQMEAKGVQGVLDVLSRVVVGPQDTRQKILQNLQRAVEQYLNRFPDTSPLKRERQNILRHMTEAANQEVADVAYLLFEKLPKDAQNAFKSKAYPSFDSVTDQDLQESLTKKRLNKTNIMLLLLQSMAEMQQTTSFKNANYDQKVSMIFGATDKHFTRLQNAARQVDGKQKGERVNEGMIKEVQNFIASIRRLAEQKSPKEAIIESIKNLFQDPLQAVGSTTSVAITSALTPASSLKTTNWMGSDTKPVDVSLFPNIVSPQNQAQPQKTKEKKKEGEQKQKIENKLMEGVKKLGENVQNQSKIGGIFGELFKSFKLF